MEKYGIDFGVLDKQLNAPKRIKLADVKDRIEKVGFGVVRFVDEKNKTNLWQVVDGEYIVAMYDEEEIVATAGWSVESDKFNKTATIFYKDMAVKNVAFAELGIAESDISNFKKVLPQRLASNQDLVRKMIESLDDTYKTIVVQAYPELTK